MKFQNTDATGPKDSATGSEKRVSSKACEGQKVNEALVAAKMQNVENVEIEGVRVEESTQKDCGKWQQVLFMKVGHGLET